MSKQLKNLLVIFLLLFLVTACSDFTSEATEFELSGKSYACDGNIQGEVINDSKTGKRLYCNGYRWIAVTSAEQNKIDTIASIDSAVQTIPPEPEVYECKNGSIVTKPGLCDKAIEDYLPLDDTEFPYAGIPRIVIETENHREIKDRETEIPAKLQIWGENAPESEIMELTIRGRGNSTWQYPKKPYAIKFNSKQNILGMPKAKNWVLLANYRDRTLIRNALALEVARRTNIGWTPQGRFAEVFLNNKYIGDYYICEKIEVSKNRLNLDGDAYLLEFDTNFDGINKFKTSLWENPVNIKFPKNVDSQQFYQIQSTIDNIEKCLDVITECKINSLIDVRSFVRYYLIYEITQNSELYHPKSTYMYKEGDFLLKAGPVWDFDWMTFCDQKKGFVNKNKFWYKKLFHYNEFQSILKEEWDGKKADFSSLIYFIDSLSNHLQKSNEYNIKLWNIKINSGQIGDEQLDFLEAIDLLKTNFINRIEELDSLISFF